MRKVYQTPTLRSRRIVLGVFGEYGDGGGAVDPPAPPRIIDGFELHMD